MKFHSDRAEIYVPDGQQPAKALRRTTHLAISAHHDDIEIMAAGPILECFQQTERWFTGVVVTDGGGSPRSGIYEHYSDEEMRAVRIKEQHKAAVIGEYAAQVLLNYPSKAVKDPANQEVVDDIAAMRSLPASERPQKLYGCEVWRDLDWMADSEKVIFELSDRESLQAALLGVFDLQIAGGKRYDLASMARWPANATYFKSHDVDRTTALSFAMDLTPLILETELDIEEYVQGFIQRFSQDVIERLRQMR